MLLFIFAASLTAATGSAEQRAFAAGKDALRAEFYPQAEQFFREFVQQYPGSTNLPEAILLQAQAQIEQTNYAGALELLGSHQKDAGTLADQYLFWLAEARFRRAEYSPAADSFAALVKQFPASPRRLEAVIREATARAQLSDWRRVVDLLQETNGVFQTARANLGDKQVLQGFLLLSEANLAQQNSKAAEDALAPLSKLQLPARLQWQWTYLLGRIRLAEGRNEEALSNSTNMLKVALESKDRGLQSDTIAFQTVILERLGLTNQAIAVCTNNLADGVPPERQRQAMLKITELSLAQNKVTDAIQTLKNFLGQFPTAPTADLAMLTLGELQLRQHLANLPTHRTDLATNTPVTTNYLQQARESFQALTNRFPQSTLLGKAQLDLGWCFWFENKLPESQAAFAAAADVLPPSNERAIAYFKLADAQLRQNNPTNALTNYAFVIEKFFDRPEIRTNLVESALYQSVRAALAAGNLPAATNALAKLLSLYPSGFHTDRAFLFAGQQINQEGKPAEARGIFSGLLTAVPEAALAPETQLAIARTYEDEEKWPEAIGQYDRWVVAYTNHQALPAALFYQARANSLARRDTNALSLFTNLVARFPTNEFTLRAQWWIGDYYYWKGEFESAEKSFQLIFERWPGSELAYPAKMMAGRCAFRREGWKDAIRFFTNLTMDPQCPPNLFVEATFAYGDTLMSKFSTNKVADYDLAIGVFNLLCQLSATNAQARLAWGELATCYLQWAQAKGQYDALTNAANAFLRVITNAPGANVTARSIATVGLGVVLEAQAEHTTVPGEQNGLLDQALEHYLAVLYGHSSVVHDNEKPDLFWTKEAGLKAGRLAEKLQKWKPAINVYLRLKELLPQLSASFDNRISKAQEHLPGIPN